MNDQFLPPGWSLRPENWMYRLPATVFGRLPASWAPQLPPVRSSDSWEQNTPIGSSLDTPPSRGLLSQFDSPPTDPWSEPSGTTAWEGSHTMLNPLMAPASSWHPTSPSLWHTPIDANASFPPPHPTDDDPFTRAALRIREAVRPDGGRKEGVATRFSESFVPHVARGMADMIALPGQEPVPIPKGLQVTDTGEWLVNGEPAAETAEGRAWLEDQQARQDWGPAMALAMLALGRIPGGAPPGAIGTSGGRIVVPPDVAAPALVRDGRLFDYSRLDEKPNLPQFDLERYKPPRGIPAYVQAVANPTNVQRVNDAARRGADQGGRAFYNTDPLRERFVAELGPERGQAAFEKYMNLNAATSPSSKLGENIRNASYHYAQWEQGVLPPAFYWNGNNWALVKPLPRPYGHLQQGLHAKKIGELRQQGTLSPLENPKTASFAQNLLRNENPVTIDRHNTRLWDLRSPQGRLLDAPPQVAYDFLERAQQTEAAKLGMTPAQYQASTWIGGASRTGVRSRLAPWLDTFETRVELTAQKLGLSKEEALRRFIRGEIPLYSLGGAAAAGTALSGDAERE
jgi:hypothetical protein